MLRGRIGQLHSALAHPGEELAAQSRLALIGERLRPHLGAGRAAARPDPGVADRLRDLLDARFPGGLGLDKAARLLHAHPTHLVRAFGAEFGMPPHHYLTAAGSTWPAAAARRMPPAEVATAAGFHDQSHLTRHFRRVTGTTPGRFDRGRGADDSGTGASAPRTRAWRTQYWRGACVFFCVGCCAGAGWACVGCAGWTCGWAACPAGICAPPPIEDGSGRGGSCPRSRGSTPPPRASGPARCSAPARPDRARWSTAARSCRAPRRARACSRRRDLTHRAQRRGDLLLHLGLLELAEELGALGDLLLQHLALRSTACLACCAAPIDWSCSSEVLDVLLRGDQLRGELLGALLVAARRLLVALGARVVGHHQRLPRRGLQLLDVGQLPVQLHLQLTLVADHRRGLLRQRLVLTLCVLDGLLDLDLRVRVLVDLEENAARKYARP